MNTIIDNIDDIKLLCDFCNQTKIVCFYYLLDKNYISVAFQIGNGYIIDLSLVDSDIVDLLNKEIFENEDIIKYSWDIKKSMICMSNTGFKFKGIFNDGLVMQYLLNLGLDNISIDKVIESELNIIINNIEGYADYILRFCINIYSKLMQSKSLYNVYRNLYCPSTFVIFEMEKNGMSINRSKLNSYIKEIKNEIKNIEIKLRNFNQVKRIETIENNKLKNNKILELKNRLLNVYDKELKSSINKEISEYKCGIKFFEYKVNLLSNNELVNLLYGKDGFMFTPIILNGKEDLSCKNEILNLIQDEYGFIKLLIEYKNFNLILRTYLLPLKDKVKDTGYIHPEFKQNGTETGRLSCVNPNLQNIPKSGEWGKKVRGLFIPPKGYKIMQCDLSQVEMRVMAYVSDDVQMVSAYARGEDIHTKTAMNTLGYDEVKWWGLSAKERSEKRDAAKAINFGFLYGMGYKTFIQYANRNFGIEFKEKEALKIRENFFNLYYSLLDFYKNYIEFCRKKGYIQTLFGRKRIVEDIYSDNKEVRRSGERKCINTVVQGTAGEYNIFATCLLAKSIGEDAIIVNSIHDSVLLYAKENKVNEVAKKAIDCFENPPLSQYFKFNFEPVGMKVNIEIGDNWGELVEYKVI